MNVREDTGRVIALALAFFGVLGVVGAVAGVFERIGAGLTLAVGVFAGAFAVATYLLDREVRAFVRGMIGPRPTPGRRAFRAAPLVPRDSATKAPAKSPGGKTAAT